MAVGGTLFHKEGKGHSLILTLYITSGDIKTQNHFYEYFYTFPGRRKFTSSILRPIGALNLFFRCKMFISRHFIFQIRDEVKSLKMLLNNQKMFHQRLTKKT